MAQTDQQHHQHDYPHLETAGSWQPPLTSSSLRQLRQGVENEQTAQPVSPIMSRRASLDSDRISTVSGLTSYFPNNPTNVNPAPAYVAPSGASQVVSEDQSSKRRPSSDEDDDEKQNKDDVQFSEQALALVNAFLDQLLYSFLSTARSTSLLALRPAVTEVLKHRLAREAIASAEEELAELLAGGDDEEEMDTNHKTAEESRRWDLELVWKRTRLRVMVYIRLGEMEDEDEQRYVKEEELFHGNERRFSQSSGLVSWAAAIFLTSVLEHVAEQTLQVAGQAASTRARRQSRSRRLAHADARAPENLVVEEHDVEKIALNSVLGRLWRTWRKALRNNPAPGSPTHRSSTSIGRISRDNTLSAMSHRRSSFETAHEGSLSESRPISRDQKDDPAEMVYPEHVLAANIPLPVGDHGRDIDEIEVPGLARDQDADSDEEDSADTPYPGHVVGALIPLPIADEKRDVDEIEVPGLARDPDAGDEDEGTRTPKPKTPGRRNSFTGTMPYRNPRGLPTSDISNPSALILAMVPPMGRERSTSLPSAAPTPMPLGERSADVDFGQGKDLEQKEGVRDITQDQETLDKLVNEERAPQSDAATETASPEGAAESKPKSEFPWMVGGAAAATAAAAGAWALGSKTLESEQPTDPTSQSQQVSPSMAKPPGNRGFGGLIRSASPHPGSKEEQNKRPTLLGVKTDTSQRSFSDKEVEELDKRKSLIDIKAMMVVNSPSSAGSGQESPQKSGTPPGFTRTISGASNRSKSWYSNGNDDHAEGASDQEGPDDAIGVARTADVPAAVAPGMIKPPSPDREEQQAREQSKRPPRLNLGDATNESSEIPVIQQAQPLSPRSQQRQFLDLTSETQPPEPQNEQSRSPSRPSQRASLANGAQQSPSVGSSQYRQSFSAPVEKNGQAAQQTQNSESPVQEHPAVQRLASLKRNEPKSPKSPNSGSDPEKSMALTSASIRGPEDFDMFVQGGDTVKYTLTPENVRDDPVSEALHGNLNGNRTNTRQTPNTARYAGAGGSPVEMDAVSQARTGRSNVPKQATSAATEEEQYQNSKRRSISRPSPRNTSSHRKSGLMAREPRVMTESTRDFADFIRSTGPNKESAVYPILANASSTSLHSLRSAHINGASASRSSSPGPGADRGVSNSAAEAPVVPPVPPIPVKSKSTMQPRGATSVSGGSSELIDFIRSGPDQDGKHRISRTVAPFRSTMDSDQLKDLGDRISTDKSPDLRSNTGAPSVRSVSSMKSSSHRTSANSRSALLNGGSNVGQTVQPAYSGRPQSLSQSMSAGPKTTVAQENEPVRKRHRNKDPYAMYYDDEDEDMLTSLPKTSRREDESLVDFLNNNEPPAASAPRPLVNPNSAQAKNIINNARANSTRSTPATNMTDGRTRSVPGSAPRSGYSSPAQSMQSSRVADINRSVGSRSKMQARGGAKDIAASSNTNDLADFLKSSGPEDPQSAPAPIVGRDSKRASQEVEKAKKKAEKKKIIGFFGRSKKKTYLDMA